MHLLSNASNSITQKIDTEPQSHAVFTRRQDANYRANDTTHRAPRRCDFQFTMFPDSPREMITLPKEITLSKQRRYNGCHECIFVKYLHLKF